MSREQDVRDAVDRFLARIRTDTDVRLEALASDLLQVVQGDAHANQVDVARAAVEIARAVAGGGSQVRHDVARRIVTAIRRLDEATSLRAILDALADGAMRETSRAAILVAAGSTMRPYRHQGFSPGEMPGELPVDASPILAAAVRLRQVMAVPATRDGSDSGLPAFMRVPHGHLGWLMPVVVGGDVAALVFVEYVEIAGETRAEDGWSEQVEVLVRHAAVRLENVTSQRTAELAGPA